MSQNVKSILPQISKELMGGFCSKTEISLIINGNRKTVELGTLKIGDRIISRYGFDGDSFDAIITQVYTRKIKPSDRVYSLELFTNKDSVLNDFTTEGKIIVHEKQQFIGTYDGVDASFPEVEYIDEKFRFSAVEDLKYDKTYRPLHSDLILRKKSEVYSSDLMLTSIKTNKGGAGFRILPMKSFPKKRNGSFLASLESIDSPSVK